jgi:REP element-mobilizing transposase RayT
LFGIVIKGKMVLNDVGKMVDNKWKDLSNRFSFISHDEYIIMPNHIHGIIEIKNAVGASLVDAPNTQNMNLMNNSPDIIKNNYINDKGAGTGPTPTQYGLSDVIGACKSITTHEYIIGVRNSNWPKFNKRLWQRNYYEHIIRNKSELSRIRKYIIENPQKWELKKEQFE